MLKGFSFRAAKRVFCDTEKIHAPYDSKYWDRKVLVNNADSLVELNSVDPEQTALRAV